MHIYKKILSITKARSNKAKHYLLQIEIAKKKKSVEAQDASRVINLHHFIVLISSPITTDCNRSRVLIDNWGRPISVIGRLVSWRHELRGRLCQRGLWRCIELGDHLLGHLPQALELCHNPREPKPWPQRSEKRRRNNVSAMIYFYLVKTRRERNTYQEDHAGTLIQRLLTPFLPQLTLLSRGDHRRHEGHHRLQIPRQLFDDLGKLRIWGVPLQHTRLGGHDLRPPQ